MKETNIQTWQTSSYLSGGNAGYIEDLYEQYLKDPQSVDPKWRNYFAGLSPNGSEISHADIRAHFEQLVSGSAISRTAAQPVSGDIQHERQQVQVAKLLDAFRRYGHYQAQLDPLNLAAKQSRPELELANYGFSNADLNTKFNIINGTTSQSATLKEIYQTYKNIYCNTIGFEYQYINNLAQVKWLQERIEGKRPTISADAKKRILNSLTTAEGLEKFLGAKYVGQTRFSIEGGDTLMPLLDEIIQRAGSQQVKEIVMGMAHRGRLNILVNLFGMTIQDLCLSFEGKLPEPGSGDVKYHLGGSSDVQTANGDVVHLALVPNPSHLEIIDPVIEGSVRARQQRRQDNQRTQVLPILLHGDAAFAGQGVVMETLAFSQTRGYNTGGTLHVISNNQIGFTISNQNDARSSWYCSDIAKMVDAPIFHVNADDPEAVIFVSQLALDFRMQFKKDVVIDLVCYRRYGHNEGDEPAATQPLMYQVIRQRPGIRKLYADKLIAEGVITEEDASKLISAYRDKLDKKEPLVNLVKNDDKYLVNWQPYLKPKTTEVTTGVPLDKLKSLAQAIETLPEGFTLQAQVAKMMEDRRKMTAGELPINWGYAETLAYATLLNEGHFIRMSGEDCQRGTFAHRHAVLHDQTNDTVYTPLEKVIKAPATLTIIDSILSEEAVLAFEYGYSYSSPESLVIWEAQYGDFVNGAQAVIDQFINCSEQKWGRLNAVTLYLPHGYEGAGPEHSSARLERFLQLCAEDNMQVCVPTTPAQIFHLIRRQVIRPLRKPLIVLTPKSVLRHKLAVSSLQDLTQGQYQLMIPEIDAIKAADVQRVILCSGKIYYDLLEQRRAQNRQDIAIIRVEQLYPYPTAEITKELEKYKKAKDIIWCQEEPKNQGAWYSTVYTLTECLAKGQTLRYAGRPAAAATAVGSKYVHAKQQKEIIDQALG